jgi:hypothetical protein
MKNFSEAVLVLILEQDSYDRRDTQAEEMALVVAPWLCFPESHDPESAALKIDRALVREYSEGKRWKQI